MSVNTDPMAALYQRIKDLEAKIPKLNVDLAQARIDELTAELAALREQVKNLQMHMLEQTAFLRKCFALDVFRNYPRLRDEGLKILDGELYNEEEK